MTNFLSKYKGVILFILTIVVMFNMYVTRIDELNSTSAYNNHVYTYEK